MAVGHYSDEQGHPQSVQEVTALIAIETTLVTSTSMMAVHVAIGSHTGCGQSDVCGEDDGEVVSGVRVVMWMGVVVCCGRGPNWSRND